VSGSSAHLKGVLATPLPLPCGVRLANRLVKEAMSEQLADRRNAVSDRLVRLYATWAESGCGLLITGNMMVDRRAISEPRQVVVEHGPTARLAPLVEAAQRGGSAVWAQLNHGGRQVPRFLSCHSSAPSPVRVQALEAFGQPRALTTGDIDQIIGRFADGAAMVLAAGFNGVQIHAAHGYLISQFLSPLTNRRDDAWGGDAERRMGFLLAVVRAVRSAVGPTVPVAVKLNSADFQRGGFTEDESLDVVAALEAEGIDLLEISGGTFEAGAMMGVSLTERARSREAYFRRYAEAAHARTGVPLMLTGGFRTAAAMEEAVASGTVDLVGLARPLAVDPSFPRRLLEGTSEGIHLPHHTIGLQSLDALAEVAWYTRQLSRMSRGGDADRRLGARTALVAYLATTARQALMRSRLSS
jgi:2,4-dienoyl-CoA reductase-like NADH-dependent reductase (Old Yellow Enzyme family)